MSISRFLVERMRRFSRFKKHDFNSHAQTAARYRRMAAAFEPVRAKLGFGRPIGVDQMIALLEVER